jgi:hypothetical protein
VQIIDAFSHSVKLGIIRFGVAKTLDSLTNSTFCDIETEFSGPRYSAAVPL